MGNFDSACKVTDPVLQNDHRKGAVETGMSDFVCRGVLDCDPESKTGTNPKFDMFFVGVGRALECVPESEAVSHIFLGWGWGF